MIHMLSRGYILPVVTYIKNCMDKQMGDVSLLRHFVVEVIIHHVVCKRFGHKKIVRWVCLILFRLVA